MRRLFALIMTLILANVMVNANAETVRPLENSATQNDIANHVYMTRITDYSAETNTATFILYLPELYEDADIMDLAVNDSILIGGTEYVITDIEEPFFDIYIDIYIDADGRKELVQLMRTPSGYWQVYEDGAYVWDEVYRINEEIPENLIFLDRIENAYGAPLYIPIYHSSRDFVKALVSEDNGHGFDYMNIYVAFDELGKPVIVERFHVPWG